MVEEYRRYIEQLTGRVPSVRALEEERGLPLYLRGYYAMAETHLFGERVLLAVQDPEAELSTPTEYGRHLAVLRDVMGEQVVLVLPGVSSYGRQQLIRLGVPFVVPHTQMFLPPLLVALSNHFPRRAGRAGLSAASQVVLLRHLLGMPVSGKGMRDLAGEVGYSAMTMSTVRRELESLGLCESVRQGRSVLLVFGDDLRSLWDRAGPYLRDPVKRIRWTRECGGCLQAGLSALESLSLVSGDDLPTYATKDSEYRSRLRSGTIVQCEGPETAGARVECWSYDPGMLSDGPTVDMLSLYLSLRRIDDERVSASLETLIGGMPW